MGVILNKTITLSNGLTVTNPYASIGENDIRMEKRVEVNREYVSETDVETVTTTTKYVLRGDFTMWVSQALRASGSRDIGGFGVTVESNTPLTENIYELLYNKLKTVETCTNAI